MLLLWSGSQHLLQAQYFQKISSSATNISFSSRTAGLIDVNDDGLIDIFFTNGDSNPSEIYINKGEDAFSLLEDPTLNTLRTPAVAANLVDIENDGDLDMYVTSWGTGAQNYLFIQDDEGFDVAPNSVMNVISFSESAGWADFNKDGYLDAILANSNGTGDMRFIGNGDGTFQSQSLSGTMEDSRCVSWADYDNDGDQDVIVTTEQKRPYFYKNEGGSLVRADVFSEEYSAFGASWGDIDNDGDLDLFLARFGVANVLLENENGTLTELESSGVSVNEHTSIGSSFGDIDNDGDLDLIVSNGYGGSEDVPLELYLNNGNKTFTEVTGEELVTTLGSYYGVAFGDYSGDGYLDVLVANVEGKNLLYKNTGTGNAWIQVQLEGTVSNADAIGARVYMYQSSGETVMKQMRELSSNSGYAGLNDMRSHFGLGALTTIDSIEVHWPEGHVQTVYNPVANQTIEVVEEIPEGYLQAHFLIDGELIAENQIAFSNNSQFDDAFVIDYEWDFNGDGTIDSNKASDSYIYDDAGDYIVSLTITNSQGTSTYSRKITIEKVASVSPAQRSFKVYPNPSPNGQLNISADGLLKELTLWDLSGNKLLKMEEVNQSSIELMVPNAGLMLIECKLQDGSRQVRKIKVHR